MENNIEKTLCCWLCTSGPISISARTDRRGYCPGICQHPSVKFTLLCCQRFQYEPNKNSFLAGESIAISADFENHSSRTIIPYATLHQTQTFFANGKSRVRGTKFTVLTGKLLFLCAVADKGLLMRFPCRPWFQGKIILHNFRHQCMSASISNSLQGYQWHLVIGQPGMLNYSKFLLCRPAL